MRLLRHRRDASGRTTDGLTVHAPAKLNLTLDVLSKRDDGFHELETLMVSVDWYDTLTFAPAEAFSLTVTGAAGVPTDGRNLVTRAARLLAGATGAGGGAAVTLHKRIPHEAGLGGGSSDAAAALLGLNDLWGCGLGGDDLSVLAAELGSDVPFFLCGRPAGVARGRGETVRSVAPRCGLHAVVAKPPVGLSTPAVFAAWGGREAACGTDAAVAALGGGRCDAVAAGVGNHLDGPASELEPVLAAERAAFAAAGLPRSCLSGSGTSRFALCRTRAAAERAAATLRRRRAGPVAAVSMSL